MDSPILSRRHLLAVASAAGGYVPQRGAAQSSGDAAWPSIRSVFEWLPAETHERIGLAIEERDVAPFIQKAFDEMPAGSTLYFPTGDYRLRTGLRLSRQINLIGDHARLVGFLGDAAGTLLEIAIEMAANANGDARLMKLEGMIFYFARGSGDAVHIHARDVAHDGAEKAEMPNLQMLIERCAFAVPSTTRGVALRIDGYLTQAHTIRNCDITNTLYLRCVDAVRVQGNLIQGDKTGVIVDIYAGAFKTEIANNVIVCRDGAILVRNGSQVDIHRNQIEQPPAQNLGERSAHLVIEPHTYDSHSCSIVGNNFGAGTNLDRSIYIDGSRAKVMNTKIEDNVFGIAGEDGLGPDVELANRNVMWTQITNNTARGARSKADPGAPVRVKDNGTGTSGIRKGPDSIRLLNGWVAGPGFSFWKSIDSVLHFEGSIGGGRTAPQTVIGILPTGFRPRVSERVAAATASGFVALVITAEGELIWQGGNSTGVNLGGISLSILGRAVYDPGV